MVLTVVLLAIRNRESNWSTGDLWLPSLTGLIGALGLLMFYLALERGKASTVIPVVGLYPVVSAVLAVVFLSEALSGIQIVGVVLAMAAVVCLGIG